MSLFRQIKRSVERRTHRSASTGAGGAARCYHFCTIQLQVLFYKRVFRRLKAQLLVSLTFESVWRCVFSLESVDLSI